MTQDQFAITVGVLALQGAFSEHLQLLRQAATVKRLSALPDVKWTFIEVRTPEQLALCDGLIIPGGESTTMSLVAARSNLLEPLREFVKVHRKPVWGTCAGLILLAESANRTKKGGQELIGGLDVRVNRNHFGRQVESFEANLDLPFLRSEEREDFDTNRVPFKSVFIRAPVVEMILPAYEGVQVEEEAKDETVVAPSRKPDSEEAKKAIGAPVEVMATLPGRSAALPNKVATAHTEDKVGDIIAVRQANVFGTSFHPELTGDSRIHVWWLDQVRAAVGAI
ncbi:pyridoxine [Xylona heveae TC161]|uniref:glutaminase n=1 Tax=Xylona heveae (strain CBS 132557 / TC161) TaxID=1328760 RepID=A0A165G3J7_XYLHT|nr:pyridoxine [Xylona heveae TC161]KZF21697.1 pyridoxine [Xylona heveae TC161]